MDDDPWGNAWAAPTTESNNTPDKSSSPHDATPTWPTTSVPAPTASDSWEASPAWVATTIAADDPGGGWGDSLEYEEPLDIPAPLPIQSEASDEFEEQVIEYLHRPDSPSIDRQNDIPHSPLPSSPPPEGSQTTSSRSSVRSSVADAPLTPRVVQIVPEPSSSSDVLDDGFGGFETGHDARLGVTASTEDDPWSPSAGNVTFTSTHDTSVVDPTVSGDTWNSAWPANPGGEVEETPVEDEWELARTKKERKDRKILPEVLSGYLTEWESVVTEIWPDAPPPCHEPSSEWRVPIEDISELQTLRKLYRLPTMTTTLSSPPPILSPLPPYFSTQLSSRQRAALKATRISPVAQLSPFAHLTPTRSIQAVHRLSTKLNASVSRPSLDFGGDVVGVGWAWAHDEKKPSPTSAPTPVVVAPTSTPSPTSATPTGRFSGFWARARGSTERPSVGQGSRSNTPVLLTSPSVSSLGEAANSTSPAAEPIVPTELLPPQSTPSEQPAPPVEQPTSGVSRFFKRFSRANPLESDRTRLATSESVSLSTSDLEFLEDFVPESNPKSLLDGGRGLTEFDALEAMLKTKPLPKDVPALAPPPRTGTSSGIPSPLAIVPEDSKSGSDDLWDIFGAPSTTTNGRPSTPVISPASASIAPSPAPKLTTPASSTPVSRAHTPRLPSIADLAAVVGGKGSHLRQTSFSTRAQQAFRGDVPSLDSPSIPTLLPPPGMRHPPPSEPDLFADFVEGPTVVSSSQDHDGTQSSTRLSFDDFGDFESSAPAPSFSPIVITPQIPIRSPSPPKPPSKTGTPVFVRAGPSIQRVPNHAILPPLLPPPPSSTGPARSGTPNIAPPAHFVAHAIAPPPPPPLSQVATPSTHTQRNLFDFGSSPPRNSPIPAPSFATAPGANVLKQSTVAETSTMPGLSASDLSFFEGL